MGDLITKFGHPDHPRYLVKLPDLGNRIAHARVVWCEHRLGPTFSGAWNYWDFNTEYWFCDPDVAWEFYLTWC